MSPFDEAPRTETGPARPETPSRGSPDDFGAGSVLLICSATVLLVGCSGTDAFHQHYRRADFRQAESLFLADSTLRENPRAVYRAGLMYADPASPIRDAERAREQFEALLELDASPDHVHAGRILIQLLERTDSLETLVSDLHRDNERLGNRIDLMRDSVFHQVVQIDSLSSFADSLRGRLHRITEELTEMEETLERFREVDLEGGVNEDG